MSDLNRIYKLIHSPLVTPYNLVDNAKLDNYEYVKYYTQDDKVVCEMKCAVDSQLMTFKYYFDRSDNLLLAVRSDTEIPEIIFDRATELKRAKLEYSLKATLVSEIA